MHHLKTIAAAGIFAALAAPAALAQAPDSPANLGVSVDLREEVRNSFIFVFHDDVPAAEVSGRANAIAGANGGRVTRVYSAALKGFTAKMPSAAAARVAAQNPNIDYYEPDGIAFAFAPPEWAKKDKGGEDEPAVCDPGSQITPLGVMRVGGPVDGTGLTAWVIDTGIDLDHRDLNVDVANSRDFVSRRKKKSPDDGNGHGTHVAGTIAAKDNDCDVVGVAAGATVVAVRVLDNSGSGSYFGRDRRRRLCRSQRGSGRRSQYESGRWIQPSGE